MASPSRQSKPLQPRISSKTTKLQPSSISEGEVERRERGRQELEVKKTQEEAVKRARGGDSESSRGSSVVDDLELTDSLSTGEFPSDITFR